jgi:hypothetical protein
MRCTIDGHLVLEATDSEILKGKAGVTAAVPRGSRLSVCKRPTKLSGMNSRIAAREAVVTRFVRESAP